jgi:voltage-gated potassium channel
MTNANSPKAAEAKVSFFQVVTLVLSVVVLGAMVVDSCSQLPDEASRLLDLLDTVICGIFLVDFSLRFQKAPSKLQFMKWGWIDLLASIPNLELLRWGRLIRVLRIIRVLRGIRSFHRILTLIFHNKLRSGFGSVLLTTFLLIFFASVAILLSERTEDTMIKTAEDAIWWSITTITTVGYGDKYPLTTEGRLIAIVLMMSGVGLFGTLSGLVASYFLGGKDGNDEHEQLLTQLEILQQKIDELDAKIGSDRIPTSRL